MKIEYVHVRLNIQVAIFGHWSACMLRQISKKAKSHI